MNDVKLRGGITDDSLSIIPIQEILGGSYHIPSTPLVTQSVVLIRSIFVVDVSVRTISVVITEMYDLKMQNKNIGKAEYKEVLLSRKAFLIFATQEGHVIVDVIE